MSNEDKKFENLMRLTMVLSVVGIGMYLYRKRQGKDPQKATVKVIIWKKAYGYVKSYRSNYDVTWTDNKNEALVVDKYTALELIKIGGFFSGAVVIIQ